MSTPGTAADMVQLLLDHGADLNSRSVSGHSPLHGAKSAEVVKLILQHGVPVDVPKTMLTSAPWSSSSWTTLGRRFVMAPCSSVYPPSDPC